MAIDKTFDEAQATLGAMHEIINHYGDITRIDVDTNREKWQQIEETYRRPYVLTLAAILDLLNTRTLSGAPLEPRYKESWGEYYKEMREILSAMDMVPLISSTMDAVQRGHWLGVKEKLKPEETFDVLQTAALSAILIPEEGGKVSDADCIAANALIRPIVTAQVDPPEATAAYEDGIKKFTTTGLAEQIAGRIEMTCTK